MTLSEQEIREVEKEAMELYPVCMMGAHDDAKNHS